MVRRMLVFENSSKTLGTPYSYASKLAMVTEDKSVCGTAYETVGLKLLTMELEWTYILSRTAFWKSVKTNLM